MKAVSSVPLMVKPNDGHAAHRGGQTQFDMSCSQLGSMSAALRSGSQHDRRVLRHRSAVCFGHQRRGRRGGSRPVAQRNAAGADLRFRRGLYRQALCRHRGENQPHGKPRLKEALRGQNFYEVLDMALEQKDNGAHILDVNVGLPGTDEAALMKARWKRCPCKPSCRCPLIPQASR